MGVLIGWTFYNIIKMQTDRFQITVSSAQKLSIFCIVYTIKALKLKKCYLDQPYKKQFRNELKNHNNTRRLMNSSKQYSTRSIYYAHISNIYSKIWVESVLEDRSWWKCLHNIDSDVKPQTSSSSEQRSLRAEA